MAKHQEGHHMCGLVEYSNVEHPFEDGGVWGGMFWVIFRWKSDGDVRRIHQVVGKELL